MKLSENLTFRANIFNYEARYYEDYNQGAQKIDFSSIDLGNNSGIAKNYQTFQNFLNYPLKEQISQLNSLTRLFHENEELGEEEIGKKKTPISKEGKVFIQIILEVLSCSISDLKNLSKELSQSSLDATSKEKKKTSANKISQNLINTLLLLDGIIMCNVDLAGAIELLGENVGVQVVEYLYIILDDSTNEYYTDYAKEVASHIISCCLVFSVKTEYNVNDYKKIIDWIINYNIHKNKTRTCLLTTNLYIILSHDNGLQCFLQLVPKGLETIIEIMTREYSINIVYEAIFCIWNIANSSKYISIFEENKENIFDKLIQVIKMNKVEKVIRIGTLCIKSLLSSEKCVEYLIDFHFSKTIKNLLSNKWSDEVIREELNYIADYLEKNNKFANSFDKYKKEIESGNLKWGFLHSSEFWDDCYKEFEFQNFEYIRLLTEIIRSPNVNEKDLEKKCIACFDLGEFAKLYPSGHSVLGHFGAKEVLLELIQNENLELKNRALVCLQKVMMRSKK